MRLAFKTEEIPYPAVTTTKTPMIRNSTIDKVARPCHILNPTITENARKIKPSTSCQSVCNGFTAAGTTCLTNLLELRTAGTQSFPALRAIFPATRPAARSWSLSTVSYYQGAARGAAGYHRGIPAGKVVVPLALRLYNQENQGCKYRGTFGPEFASL